MLLQGSEAEYPQLNPTKFIWVNTTLLESQISPTDFAPPAIASKQSEGVTHLSLHIFETLQHQFPAIPDCCRVREHYGHRLTKVSDYVGDHRANFIQFNMRLARLFSNVNYSLIRRYRPPGIDIVQRGISIYMVNKIVI